MKHILYLITFLLPSILFAEEWTLTKCIDYALANNSQIQKIKNTALISDQNRIQAQASRLPTITGTATHNYNWGRNIDPFTNVYSTQQVRSNNLSLNGSLVLFNGFLIHNTIQQSKYEKLATETDIQQAQLDLSISIIQAYLSILLNQEKLKQAEQQSSLTQTQADRLQRLKNSGAATDGQVLDITAQLKLEEANVIIARNTLQLSLLQLGLLLELPNPTDVQVVTPNLNAIETTSYENPDGAFQNAKENVPQLKSLEYKQQAASYQYHASKGRYYPRLTLNASISTLYSTSGREITGTTLTGQRLSGVTSAGDDVYTYTYSSQTQDKPLGRQFEDNLGRFIGLNLSIPILNGLQTRTTVHRNFYAMEQANLETKIATYNLQKSIYTYYYQAKSGEQIYQAQNAAMTAQEESYRNAQKRLENGVITTIEYNQIKTRYNQSTIDLLTSKYDFIFKNAILDIYTGKTLSF
ncbi:MAG: TolC family protein [Cytophagaceae bacterium]